MTTSADLCSMSKTELARFCESLDLEPYRADQILQWIHQKQVCSPDQMTNLSKKLRDLLGRKSILRRALPSISRRSKDGTLKSIFDLYDGNKVESVLIPEFFDDGEADRLTVCVSSQAGCAFGCSFCATGKMGLLRNLTIGEITGQVAHMNKQAEENYGKRITNVVYMGMGEPFHNYHAVIESAAILCDPSGMGLSPRRITISTVGLGRLIIRYGAEQHPYPLAISLHAADDEKRSRIMPINESRNLASLREAVCRYHESTGRPVTYEYLLFDRFNDFPEDAGNLAGIAKWVPSKINIIMYNHVDGVTLFRASENRLNRFMAELTRRGVRATVRRSRGDDIEAGCGQLVIKNRPGKTLFKSAHPEGGAHNSPAVSGIDPV